MEKKKQISLIKLLKGSGEIVKKYMYDNRLKLDEMSKKAKVSSPTVNGILNGKIKNISVNKLVQVINACDYIVTEVGIEPK